jgi:hypothetical protein
MNRIYATYFAGGKYPARTTVVVSALPSADFLLEIEIECEALIEWRHAPLDSRRRVAKNMVSQSSTLSFS